MVFLRFEKDITWLVSRVPFAVRVKGNMYFQKLKWDQFSISTYKHHKTGRCNEYQGKTIMKGPPGIETAPFLSVITIRFWLPCYLVLDFYGSSEDFSTTLRFYKLLLQLF
ncbi:uncharacterized protein LOC113358655 [Papaver somniferum]|uniref:uncharacterized protein LOC113358655 n=1 Tax=Papaver somniferum TaxID=3469 RepID=UPI000E7056C0|nr:uncharacterized protein LOC113358655 [Papaver somniferum]